MYWILGGYIEKENSEVPARLTQIPMASRLRSCRSFLGQENMPVQRRGFQKERKSLPPQNLSALVLQSILTGGTGCCFR